MSYGGVDIPGCPIYQQMADNVMPTVNGEGLQAATENCPASFIVCTGGHQGDLTVSVEGPNSVSRCTVDPLTGGQFKVTYIPVEVGIYAITIKWNGREIPGSPYHPSVINPEKLVVLGGWLSLYGNSDKINLNLCEPKVLEFDSCQAGPGQLTVKVSGPDGVDVVTNVVQHDVNRFSASFTPKIPGNYLIDICWAGVLLKRCPIIACAIDKTPPPPPQPPKTVPENVVLIGTGLTNARIKEEAEFIIDGSNAGPGKPVVKLMGVKCDISATCSAIGNDRYKCCYTPEIPGAYLLSISWSDYQVPGSPFKVSVTSGTDSSKVVCTGDGLKGGAVGQELCIVVDTRRAGPGELLAQCKGPTKPAFCQLEDQHDGTFLLKIKAQEAGSHLLKVTFAGEQIQDSPFTIKVTAQADASKVRVSGPGIQPGILATFQSEFVVETSGAGPGRLTVRVRGPKGAFRVEMSPDPSRDRAILCRYNPTEVGQYILQVQWSGENVPGSPFAVSIVDTRQELEMLKSRNLVNGIGTMSISSNGRSTFGVAGGTNSYGNEPLYIEPVNYGSGTYGNGNYSNGTLSSGDGLIFNDDF
jgi:filamin